MQELGALANSAALFDAVSESIFQIARPTLDPLYAALCAGPDALYAQQLKEMRCLLPQHMGVRQELWLLPAVRSAEQTAELWRRDAALLPQIVAEALLSRFPPRTPDEIARHKF